MPKPGSPDEPGRLPFPVVYSVVGILSKGRPYGTVQQLAKRSLSGAISIAVTSRKKQGVLDVGPDGKALMQLSAEGRKWERKWREEHPGEADAVVAEFERLRALTLAPAKGSGPRGSVPDIHKGEVKYVRVKGVPRFDGLADLLLKSPRRKPKPALRTRYRAMAKVASKLIGKSLRAPYARLGGKTRRALLDDVVMTAVAVQVALNSSDAAQKSWANLTTEAVAMYVRRVGALEAGTGNSAYLHALERAIEIVPAMLRPRKRASKA